MNLADILLLLLLLAAAGLAVRSILRRKKHGCGCGCAGCSAPCSSRRRT